MSATLALSLGQLFDWKKVFKSSQIFNMYLTVESDLFTKYDSFQIQIEYFKKDK